MKLKSKVVRYSSVVGVGLMLTDERGAAMFIVNFMGASKGISKAQSEALSEQIDALINANGLSVPNEFPPGDPKFSGGTCSGGEG